MGVKWVATGSTRAKSNASPESRASHPSHPYPGKARSLRARKYPRKSEATVTAVRARPSVVRADGMSVEGAVFRFMIAQSGDGFSAESRREILRCTQDDCAKKEHRQDCLCYQSA